MDPTFVQTEQLRFVLTLSFYLLPALVGSLISSYMKNISKITDNDKSTRAQEIAKMIFSAIVPAILLASVHPYLSEVVDQTALLIGIAFIAGCMGEELLRIVTSFSSLLKVIRVLGTKIAKVKDLADVVSDIADEVNKEEDKKEEEKEENTDDKSDK